MDSCQHVLSPTEPPPTTLCAALPPGARGPAVADMAAQLRTLGHEVRPQPRRLSERWRIGFGRLTLALLEMPDFGPAIEILGPDLTAADVARVREASLALHLSGPLDQPAVGSFHERLRLVHALSPDAVAVFDDGACTWHSDRWLRCAAESCTAPGPRSLFVVHAVAADSTDPATPVWLHTHGLARCGAIELEMLDVPADEVPVMAELLEASVSIFLEEGVPPVGEPVRLGSGFDFAWLPWRKAVRSVPPRGPGGRGDRDELHNGARGVLVAPRVNEDGSPATGWLSAAQGVERVDGALLFRVPTAEGHRRTEIALERFRDFRALVARFAGTSGWEFLAELGYSTDDDEPEDTDQETSTECMWFEVHAVNGARLDATLLDDPQRIARMERGQRGWHAVDQLGDFAVLSPFGVFEPDRIDVLFEHVGGRKRRRRSRDVHARRRETGP